MIHGWLGRGPESVARSQVQGATTQSWKSGREATRGSGGGGGPACGVAHRDLRLCETFVRVQQSCICGAGRWWWTRACDLGPARPNICGLWPTQARLSVCGRHGTEGDDRHRPCAGDRISRWLFLGREPRARAGPEGAAADHERNGLTFLVSLSGCDDGCGTPTTRRPRSVGLENGGDFAASAITTAPTTCLSEKSGCGLSENLNPCRLSKVKIVGISTVPRSKKRRGIN